MRNIPARAVRYRLMSETVTFTVMSHRGPHRNDRLEAFSPAEKFSKEHHICTNFTIDLSV